MLRSEWGHFSAEYGFGDAWGRAGSTSDEVAGGGGGGMSPETARGLADYERRLQTTRDANAARAAINRGDTERAATILSANPEVWIEVDGQRMMGEGAASYLTRNAQQTAADAGRRLAVQPPDLSNRGVPELSMPPGAPSGQIPLEVVSTSASLPPPPPPPSPSTASDRFATRGGIDRAAAQRQGLEAEFARQQLQAGTSAQSGVGARPRTSQAGGEGAGGGTSYTVSVHELGVERWSSQISPEQIGRQLYRNAARGQGLTQAQAEAFTSANVGIPHVIDERGRVRQMTRSDLDNLAVIGNSHNTNHRGEYNAIVPHEVLAQMREFKREWEASTPANPLPMGGGAIPFPAPRPLELPRLSPGAAARTAATVTGAVGEAAVPLAAGAASAAPFVYLAWQLGQEIGQSRAATEAAQERARVLPPPPLPPMRMTDEDEPLPTSPAAPADTAERPQQPRIRVAPDETGMERARPNQPSVPTPPASSRPTAPRQAPQPPQLPPPRFDPLPPLVGLAGGTGAGLLAQRAREVARAREAERVFNEQMQRAEARGRFTRLDPDDQAWINADPTGRRKRLAFDPDEGDFRVNEARAAIAAEEAGALRGQVDRAFNESGRSLGADIVDADGRLWDIKEARASVDDIVGAASSANGSPENVLVDMRGLTAAERQALRNEINRRTLPPGSGEIRYVPEN